MGKKIRVDVEYNGDSVPCFFDKLVWSLTDRARPCPLCRKHILKGDIVYLIINNYVLFPNTVCHEECVGKADEALVMKLTDDYEHSRAVLESIKHWFGD